MNVYDFDNTIYDGESIIDFFSFVLKKDFKLIKYCPGILKSLILYKFNKISIESINHKIDKFTKSFFKNRNYDFKALGEEFWKKNIHKLKPQFLEQLKQEDLIITGCPNFLIEHIKDKLKVHNIICTHFNLYTKEVEFICFGNNKIIAFQEHYKDKKIKKLYTDSMADKPLMELAEEVYFVHKNKVKLIDKKRRKKKLI